jgi:hypothetical protein
MTPSPRIYEHIQLDANGVPSIAGTTMKVVELVMAQIAHGWANWEREYDRVGDWQEADHAIDMLEYVQLYYVPGPGYRSHAQTEAALEAQRARTLAAIVACLRRFCGEDFGT